MRDRNVTRAEGLRWAAWLLLGFGLISAALTCGCANPELTAKRVIGTTAVAISGAYESLNRVDREICLGLVEKAKTDPQGADREFAAHKARVKIAIISLATADDALRVSNSGSKLYKAIAAKDWGRALQELLAIGFAVRDALKVFGVEVPL
jgi:hypothetical protein